MLKFTLQFAVNTKKDGSVQVGKCIMVSEKGKINKKNTKILKTN